ncbi:MAG: DEAD/DEAH box helicase [Legionella sp.]|nr:DEAD/DEAH box helicase [Legionella sp.]
MISTNSLAWAHPLVRDWFNNKFGRLTEPQEQGWPSILEGKNTLIAAPTGSGKTFAAFLVCIDQLVRQSIAGIIDARTQVLYISPLKALTNDVQKNLLGPLAEIMALGKKRGLDMREITVAVRTGDTLARERQAMLKKPPHILVTTPESFYLLITAEKSRNNLTGVNTLIIDEIHALANNKRGTHLLLSLERLEAICVHPPVRIGLSATQKPLEVVAQFMTGSFRPLPVIVNVGHTRKLELDIEVPSSELSPVASNETWDEIYNRIAFLARQNRSTLIFVNTRKLAERVAHHLAQRLGKDKVSAHHGSLSRKLRLSVEEKLKSGQLQALVATASLELGIDIGTIDLVCQIGSTRAISVALQRIGRAGHWFGAIPKGRIFATTRDELLESAALVYAIKTGDLDALIIPVEPLDILAQQIVASCATNDWHEDALYKLVRGAYPYRHLKRKTFTAILEMLSEGIAGTRGRYSAYLFRDQINGIVKARRGSRLIAITSGGAIPENGLFTVIAEPHGAVVGTLDEDFAIESTRGDIILLGSTSWKIRRVESSKGRILVEDAFGAPPTVPFWRGEAPSRTKELSLQVSNLRKKMDELLPATVSPVEEVSKQPDALEALTWLKKHTGVDTAGAEQIVEYIIQGRAVLGAVPTQENIIAERFFDEAGGMQLIIHAPFGAAINKAWGLALRKRFCRSFNFELQAAATDDGINISLAEQHSFPLSDVFHFLHANTIEHVLTQAVLQSPLFKTRWRWDATRALALIRYRNGKKIPANIARMLSDDLLAAVFPDAAACQDNLAGEDIKLPEHPLITETMKDCLTEAMDIDGLIMVLNKINAGEIKCLAVDTPMPSAFSHEILNANPYAFLDDAPLEERRARAVEMRRVLPEAMLGEIGLLNPLAIIEVQKQAWPDIRNADELHDFLQTVIALPLTIELNEHQPFLPLWHTFFATLKDERRALIATNSNKHYWVATEKIQAFHLIYPDAVFDADFRIIEQPELEPEEALLLLLRGWAQHIGPFTSHELEKLLTIDLAMVEQILLRLEASGTILRGHFRNNKERIEWCERRLLARIHRLTVGILRKEIEPVTALQFTRWLALWQHLAAGTQLRGEHGLLEVIKQLQGYEIPANAWEKEIFARRVADYNKDWLDHLCFTGAIGWGRLSPHPTLVNQIENAAESCGKRIQPTSVTPITFFVRETIDWMAHMPSFQHENLSVLSHIARDVYGSLKANGASFFTDIVDDVKHLKSEVETALWELVSAGLITADGFDNLRALIDPKRRLLKRRRRVLFRQATGRWSLLKAGKSIDKERHLEAICQVLLNRYGVFFRELLAREKITVTWRELLITFRRLEDRGEIRGGRFISGFLGEQFALPTAVNSLRAIKNKPLDTELISISGVDPLNLAGIILPGVRIPAFSGKKINLLNGNTQTAP